MEKQNLELRKSYVRETASRLSNVGLIALSHTTSIKLAHLFKDLADDSIKNGADIYHALLSECQALCEDFETLKISEEQILEATELLKECSVAVQTSLFTYALFGDPERDSARLKEKVAQVRQFKKNIQRLPVQKKGITAPPNDTPSPTNEPNPDGLDSLVRSSIRTSPQALSDRNLENESTALTALARLTEQTWENPTGCEELVRFIRAYKESHFFSFQEVCEGIKTVTPETLIEPGCFAAIREQLRAWSARQREFIANSTAQARIIGSRVWLELRIPRPFILPDDAAENRGGPKNAFESYISGEGLLVYRRSFELKIPVFEGYEVELASGKFVIPVTDIHLIQNGTSKSKTEARTCNGPFSYLARDHKGIGVAWSQKNEQIQILDLTHREEIQGGWQGFTGEKIKSPLKNAA